MSKDSTQEQEKTATDPAADSDPAPARKTARKKAAATTRKTAAKKTARKAAKKAAARKTAKAAAPEQQAELPLQDAPAAKEREAAQPEAPKPDRRPAAESGKSDGQADNLRGQDSQDEPTRFGRVPGGGPVKQDRPPRSRADQDSGNPEQDGGRRRKRRRKRRRNRDGDDQPESGHGQEPRERPGQAPLDGPKEEVAGLLEMAPKGFGFLRTPDKDYEQARDDVFVSPDLVRRNGLRVGVRIEGLSQQGPRGPQLVEITSINDLTPDEFRRLPAFEELKATNPDKRVALESDPNRFTTRVLDLMAPVGRGQRGLIVSPPRSGKTTLLQHIAESVQDLHEETMHLMVLLVDERPEEVTEFRRALPDAEIFASSNDEPPRNHIRLAELAIERAKRLVEGGTHVFLLMDSITRLARAYNNSMGKGRGRGRGIGSGGVMVGALEAPRRLFAAARNTREAGSLTILATALVQTNSRADDAIFQEFKGTGNMELVLDRKVAENYIYPAVDIFKSGTRREELLLPEHSLNKINMIRRGLSGHRPLEAMERLLFFLKKFPNNPQMLLEIKG